MKKLLIIALLLTQLPVLAQESVNSKLIYVCPPCNNSCDNLEFEEKGKCIHCGMKLILPEELKKYTDTKRKKIAFYLQNGVEVLDFAGPMEVFSYAGHEVFTVSKTKEPIISQGILKIIPDYNIDDAPKADILAFFGGNSSIASEDPEIIHWIKSQKDVENYLSVCTGAFILAESGILNGKTATTFHNSLEELEKTYPEINVLKNVRFVDNGQIITTAGISAGIDGALHLVAKLQGIIAARKTAYYMEYDKWVPGEGLILSQHNPYEDIPQISRLKDYVGVYENQGESSIHLIINEREKSLEGAYEEDLDRNYPLFYIDKDKFENLNQDEITFERDQNNKVTGFRVSDKPEKLYQKKK
ncbi:DJ-1/PfpI family protein, partial [Xanthovirga aplysinae]|uniref:DJ-1/PfpI family protein n=1 Tax=Xanthovirga aplysinae TaxID=2529853 RepID=UPI0016572BEF